MGEWLAIEEWRRCLELAKPGIIFEVRNRHGQTLMTECTPGLPPTPFDWKSPPSLFRAIPEPPPERSSPLPPPRNG